MSVTETETVRVAVVADRRLTGEVIAAALASRSVRPINVPWPQRDQIRRLRRKLERSGVRIGVVLCGLESPDRVRELRLLVSRSGLRWLVLTDTPPGAHWGALLELGVVAVLPTPPTVEELVRVVADAYSGQAGMPSALREKALREWQTVSEEQRSLERRLSSLTPRETEVLRHLYEGASVREIAAAEGIAEATVRSHVKSIRRKLAVDSQLAAVTVFRRARDFLASRW